MKPIVMFAGKKKSGKDTAGGFIAVKMNGQCIALSDPMKRFLMGAYDLTAEQLWGSLESKESPITLLPRPSADTLLDAFYEATDGAIDNDEMDGGLSEALDKWARKLPPKTTPRHMMQTFGTECVRALDPNFWIDYGLQIANELLHGGCTYDRTKGVIPVEPGKAILQLRQRPIDVVVITDGRFRNEIHTTRQVGHVVKLTRPGLPGDDQHASEMEQDTIPDWWFDAVVKNDGDLLALKNKLDRLIQSWI